MSATPPPRASAPPDSAVTPEDQVAAYPTLAPPSSAEIARHRAAYLASRRTAPTAPRGYPRIAWVVVTGLFVVGPLVLAKAGGWHADRGFVAELGSSLGIVALGVLALELVLTARLRILQGLGADVAVRLHRRLASVLLSLVVAHVVIAVAAEPARLALFQFFGEPWRAQAAIGSVVALALIGVTSVYRRQLRLPYARWRLLHLLFAAAAMILATVHTVGWDRYLMAGAGIVALGTLTIGALASAGTLRLRRPLALGRAPYVIERVIHERGASATLQLRATGHRGQPFHAGQFAWLKLAGRPLGTAEHPFSYSSSAERPERPSFTIRAYDGFSARAAHLRPGTAVLVDGPHGSFRVSDRAGGIVLISTGIGITPAMSILRTAADRADRRPILLVYGSRNQDGITFQDELEELRGELNLSIVHVLSRPADDWAGERGRITADVLERHLPADMRDWQFFLCGSGPAVDAALQAITAVGVPPERVHAERFVEV